MFEEKIRDRQDYLDLFAQTRGNDDDLYKKIVDAGESKLDALFSNEKENTSKSPNKEDKSPENHTKDMQQPLRRTNSKRGKRNSKKNNFNQKTVTIDNNKPQEVEDEELVALTWAYNVLKDELMRRNKIREGNKIETVHAKQKMQAYLAFKKDLEERSSMTPADYFMKINYSNYKKLKSDSEKADKKPHKSSKSINAKNVVTASSIVNFLQRGTNPEKKQSSEEKDVSKTPEQSDLKTEDTQQKAEVKEKDNCIKEEPPKRITKTKVPVQKNQLENAQKIIDRVMPKKMCDEGNNIKDVKSNLEDLEANAVSQVLSLHIEEGRLIFRRKV